MKINRILTTGTSAYHSAEDGSVWTTFLIGDLRFEIVNETGSIKAGEKWWGRVNKTGEFTSQGVWAESIRELFSGLRGRLGERKARAFSGLDAGVE